MHKGLRSKLVDGSMDIAALGRILVLRIHFETVGQLVLVLVLEC